MIAAAALLTHALRDADENIAIEEGRRRVQQNDEIVDLDHAMIIFLNLMFFLTGFFLYIFVSLFIYWRQDQSDTTRMLLAPNDSFYFPSGSTSAYYHF